MEEDLNNNSKKKMSGFKKIIIFIIVIAVISAIVSICNTNTGHHKAGYDAVAIANIVRKGSIESFPDVVFGDVFDNFFDNPTWLGYIRKDNQKVVEFSGNALLDGNSVLVKVLFEIDKQDFNIIYLSVDGVAQPKEEIVDWLRVIYAEYYRK